MWPFFRFKLLFRASERSGNYPRLGLDSCSFSVKLRHGVHATDDLQPFTFHCHFASFLSKEGHRWREARVLPRKKNTVKSKKHSHNWVAASLKINDCINYHCGSFSHNPFFQHHISRVLLTLM